RSDEADSALVLAIQRESQRPRQERPRARITVYPERDAVESTDGVLGRHPGALPAENPRRIAPADELDWQAVRIDQCQYLFVEARPGPFVSHTGRAQPCLPEVEGGRGHQEGGRRRLSQPGPAGEAARPREESEDG